MYTLSVIDLGTHFAPALRRSSRDVNSEIRRNAPDVRRFSVETNGVNDAQKYHVPRRLTGIHYRVGHKNVAVHLRQ